MRIRDLKTRINVFLKDKERKKNSAIIKEVLDLWIMRKEFPIHYFGRFLYRKNIKSPKSYINLKEYYQIIYAKEFNKEAYISLLENKLMFGSFCEKNKLPTPLVQSYNFDKIFFFQDKTYSITNKEKLYDYFLKIFQETNLERLFLKPISNYGGKGIHMLLYSNLKSQLEEFGSDILENAYIHQNCIEQHPKINQIYPHSINTIRIETYIDINDKVRILGAAIRFGIGGMIIDNFTSGGFFVPIDPKTGKLAKKGVSKMIRGGDSFQKHPDTGFVFENFEIPFFKESCNLCLRATQLIPNRLIGWDIAITPIGPTIVEGNKNPGIFIGEIANGGYVDHPMYKEIIKKKTIVIK